MLQKRIPCSSLEAHLYFRLNQISSRVRFYLDGERVSTQDPEMVHVLWKWSLIFVCSYACKT